MNKLKAIACVFLLIFFLNIIIFSNIAKSSLIANIDNCLNTQNFNGSILISKNSEILISKGYGYADFKNKSLNNPTTKFKIASLSKAFTALAILQLCQKSLLNLDNTIDTFIPNWPNGNQITIHQLLTHTSGIASLDYDNKIEYSHQDIIDRIKLAKVEFEPVTKLNYSNSGYILLAHLVEVISGQSFDNYLKFNVFDKLNMLNTGCDYQKFQENVSNRAIGYISQDILTEANNVNENFSKGCGGVYSTAEDLLKWSKALSCEAILNKSSLNKISYEHMQDPQHPTCHWGYGWCIDKFFDKKFAFHTGKFNGFSSVIFKFLEEDINVIVLSNVADIKAFKIAIDLTKILLNK